MPTNSQPITEVNSLTKSFMTSFYYAQTIIVILLISAMQKEDENQTKKPADLTLLDQLAIQVNLDKKIISNGEIDLGENMQLSNEMIDKITYFCVQKSLNLKELTVWGKREDIGHFFNNLNRLRQTLMKVIALTSGKEDLSQQAERFKIPVQKFLTLYILALEEVEKHKDTLDPVLQIPVVTEPDLEGYKLVLEDDIMQDIFSTNHLILELLKKDPETHFKIKEILEDY